MEKQRYIVIDTETTGLGYGAEVLQFSAVDQDGKTVMDVYVKPVRVDEWPETEAVHQISPADVACCPTMFRGGIGRKITALLESYPLVVGYNIAFDLQMLRQSGCRVPPELTTQDVMQLFAPVYGEWNEEKQDYKWHVTYAVLPHQYSESHSAHIHISRCADYGAGAVPHR